MAVGGLGGVVGYRIVSSIDTDLSGWDTKIMAMRPIIPADLPDEPRAAYVRGWNDRGEAGAKRAGGKITSRKSASSSANLVKAMAARRAKLSR